jgi:hypothetical protein
MTEPYIIQCPYCEEYVFIEELNCRIFRHACFKNGEPIPPHASKEECDRFIQQGLVYGCAKPFQILLDGTVVKCDYI